MNAYPLAAIRALVLHTQGLSTANGAESPVTPEAVVSLVERIGALQIDTLQRVRRSQYVALWSRLGRYDPAIFERLINGDPTSGENPRRFFEGWMHCACILPLSEYRYQIPHMHHVKANPASYSLRWLNQPGSAELIQQVLERVRRDGAVRVGDFEYNGPKRGSWWDWKPAKQALEHLYAWGDLMIAGRDSNFARIYDLTERVRPHWVDTTEPTREERDRHWIELAARSFGVCLPGQLRNLAYLKQGAVKPVLEELLAAGTLVPVRGRLHDGKEHELVVHREHLPLLEQAADGALAPRRTTFLSPFDNLFWPQRRDTQLWGFYQALEAYKPAPQRQWGYFCLPILHHDRLIGRFDAKLERQQGRLRLEALYLESGVEPKEELVADVAVAMRDFLTFHNVGELVVDRSVPTAFGEKIVQATQF